MAINLKGSNFYTSYSVTFISYNLVEASAKAAQAYAVNQRAFKGAEEIIITFCG